jgi:hypothetical protein
MLNRDASTWPPFPGPDAPEAVRLRWSVERFLTLDRPMGPALGRPARPSGALGSNPAELARRVAAFRQQLSEWTASGRVGAPVFGLPGVAVVLGQCVGCGEPLAEGRAWRCPLCVRAVELTLGLSSLEEPGP